MLQIGKERILAVVVIVISGILSMSGLVDRQIAMCIAILAFAIGQGWYCFKLWKAQKAWKRESIISVIAIVVLFVVLQ